jgi:hypothetical protein
VHALQVLLYPRIDLVFGVPRYPFSQLCVQVEERCTYFFMMFTSRARVVRSIDFKMTLFLGVIGEFASFRALKFSTLFKILFAAIGRRCINIPRLLSVAVTTRPSLYPVSSADIPFVGSSDL